MSFLEWRGLAKTYDGTRALDGFTLSVGEGEILGILGPSGSGKSTLLRITAGLETPSAGGIILEGQDLAGIPPHRRGFGLMFQEYCLFPHLSVKENVGFGLRMKGMTREARRARVEEMLRLVRLRGFDKRDVLSLSGGEQQRVALARSLAPAPRLLMLDEPLGALDAALRGSLIGELAQILREAMHAGRKGTTVLYVTHDHEEAMAIAARIALINRGKLVQAGTPEELIRAPANAFVASFLGLGAVVPGAWKKRAGGAGSAGRKRVGSAWLLETEIGGFPAGAPPHDEAAVGVLVRPEAVRFSPRQDGIRVRARILGRGIRPGGISLRVVLEGKSGTEYRLECTVGGSGNGSGLPAPPDGEQTVWLDPSACLAVSL